MLTLLAVTSATVLAALALLHIYWAFAPGANSSSVVPTRLDGTPLLHPGPVSCFAVAALLLLAALLIMETAGAGPGWLPRPWPRIGTCAVAVALLARGIGDFRYVGLFKQTTTTSFARRDTQLYTPLVIGLSTAAGAVAWLAPY